MNNIFKVRNFNIFLNLTKRHLKVFFKNKIRLLYTLLVPIIILIVYIFFLRDLELTSVISSISELFEDDLDLVKDETFLIHIDSLVDSWMLSGIISLSTITVSLQTNNIFVEDKENGLNRDFISSPINKNVLIFSYFCANFLVTLFISFIVVVVVLIYLVIKSEFVLNILDILLILGILVYSTIISTLTTVFICLFINSEATLASIIALVSTAAGFLIGAYMPIALLPSWVVNICAFIPGTYSTSLFRFAFLSSPISNLSSYLSSLNLSIDVNEVTSLFINEYGYNVSLFGRDISVGYQALVILIFIILFVILNIVFSNKMTLIKEGMKKKKKK